MTIRECIDYVDDLNPNQYSDEKKVKWLSDLDHLIVINIINFHHLNVGEEIIEFTPYSTSHMEKELIAGAPYDDMYFAYLQMKIDEANKETSRYNNDAVMFNAYYDEYAKSYNRTHRPINNARYRMWRH